VYRLEGVFPIALPPEFVQESGNLSIIEKYLLTLCDGKRDLQWITEVAPVQSQVVVKTIQRAHLPAASRRHILRLTRERGQSMSSDRKM
jgi:hypothetical protein